MSPSTTHDAVVIGGGFYGATIAIHLASRWRLRRVLLVEREPALLQRASYSNQARVHNGYHYPRSFTTAYRSRVNLPRFMRDWPDAIKTDFTKLYAIARRNSKVTARQFERFCRSIGADIRPARQELQALFDTRLIEAAYEVTEYAFDTRRLAAWTERELRAAGVEVRLGVRVRSIASEQGKAIRVLMEAADGAPQEVVSQYVFNCTYSGLNQFGGDFASVRSPLKHEITEMPLVQMPPELRDVGITVMDGPFFSMMPFPARGLHTLSHVRYTPHMHWLDSSGADPYERLERYAKQTRVDRMTRDVARYIPAAAGLRYVESLFEIKTVLTRNESDDGRPILFEKHPELPGCYSVLGGKMDNIYDVLERLDHESL